MSGMCDPWGLYPTATRRRLLANVYAAEVGTATPIVWREPTDVRRMDSALEVMARYGWIEGDPRNGYVRLTKFGHRAMAGPTAEPGQIWQDNDARSQPGRFIRVLEVLRTIPAVAVVVQCTSQGSYEAKDRRTRIRLSRFWPTSSGYRLVRDVS